MKIIECPRDAMQGIKEFIPTAVKIDYINKLLRVGFDTIDFGSFVSPKAVPQMKDTHEVIQNLDLSTTSTQLLAIVANMRGVTEAMQYDSIRYLGYPLSISETFQQRNTNSSISDGIRLVEQIQQELENTSKELVVYLSMGFGNPYGDDYSQSILQDFVDNLADLDIKTISVADTVGNATGEQVQSVFRLLELPLGVEVGAHLHSIPTKVRSLTKGILQAGCKRIDTAILGYGGCPFAKEELTGNLATEQVLEVLQEEGLEPGIDRAKFAEARHLAMEVFNP